MSAAKDAQRRFAALPLAQRKRIIEAVRTLMRAHVDELSTLAVQETGLGRVEDKK
ncbi:MAG: aldehyde dehydrogenase family protein, partial [Deltaproteobacteria bacterium]|nr:aldehyde dehydrogenase family protein [Deltaproteobacteria bacterium]